MWNICELLTLDHSHFVFTYTVQLVHESIQSGEFPFCLHTAVVFTIQVTIEYVGIDRVLVVQKFCTRYLRLGFEKGLGEQLDEWN